MTAPTIADRVKESTGTTGTGTLNLAGPAGGFQSFVAGVGSGSATYYALLSGNGTDWEVGIGTVTSGSPDTLSRTTVLASAIVGVTGTSKITLSGTSTVFCTRPASALSAAQYADDLPITLHASGGTIGAAGRGAIHQHTAATAQTFTLNADQAGWWILTDHQGTGTTGATKKLILSPNSGTIDGAASTVAYPGDRRLITFDGTNYISVLIQGGYVELQAADSPFTFTTPSAAQRFYVEAWGGGGSGGSGNSAAAGSSRAGGGGGGGGACIFSWFKPIDLGSSVTCTIAAQVAGGTSSTSASGKVGTAGNNSTVGSLLTAYGGGRGGAGLAAINSGGGGGGWHAAGGGGSAAASIGGGSTASGGDGDLKGGGCALGGDGHPASFGGGAGGGSAVSGAGGAGGCATKGGPGGGPGGNLSSSNAAVAGGAGGKAQGATQGGGGSGGSAGTSGAPGGSPSAASLTPTALGPGLGGGGGGAGFGTATISAAGAGGDGGVAAGGGGGGASDSTAASGVGGQGGPGLMRIWYYP